jgi:3-mercaptopyruvate sulfurtransferase SseA
VAQKLHDTYGYSYDNLKVLLGGWSAWQGAGYPTETGGSSGSTTTQPPVVINTVVITP